MIASLFASLALSAVPGDGTVSIPQGSGYLSGASSMFCDMPGADLSCLPAAMRVFVLECFSKPGRSLEWEDDILPPTYRCVENATKRVVDTVYGPEMMVTDPHHKIDGPRP